MAPISTHDMGYTGSRAKHFEPDAEKYATKVLLMLCSLC